MRALLAVQLYGESLIGRDCFSNDQCATVTITGIVTKEWQPNDNPVMTAVWNGYPTKIRQEDSLDFAASSDE